MCVRGNMFTQYTVSDSFINAAEMVNAALDKLFRQVGNVPYILHLFWNVVFFITFSVKARLKLFKYTYVRLFTKHYCVDIPLIIVIPVTDRPKF